MTDKTQGKAEIKIGNITFQGEGDQQWLGEQLTKVIEAAAATGQVQTVSEAATPPGEIATPAAINNTNISLAAYLKQKGGDNKQVLRFLATAAWLFRRGERSLTTGTVAKALTDNHQKKLANASDCLNQNVSKGYCEKTKEGFFITPEGWESLGEAQP